MRVTRIMGRKDPQAQYQLGCWHWQQVSSCVYHSFTSDWTLMPLLSDCNMELIWIILGWVTGGGKSLGTAMWLLVPRGQAWSGVVYQSTFLKHSISVKNSRIPHCLSQYLERSARKSETIPRMAALQSLHQRLAFQLTSQLSPTHHNPAPSAPFRVLLC
jgi:hypothetical protein